MDANRFGIRRGEVKRDSRSVERGDSSRNDLNKPTICTERGGEVERQVSFYEQFRSTVTDQKTVAHARGLPRSRETL